MSGNLQVLQRGTGMVLAGHYTPVHHGRLTAATLETVTFDRPHKIGFRLVRGPVPGRPVLPQGHPGRGRAPYPDLIPPIPEICFCPHGSPGWR
jgi:hypothetical protein